MRTLKSFVFSLAAVFVLASCASLPATVEKDGHEEDDHKHGDCAGHTGYAGRLLASTVDGDLLVLEAGDGDLIRAFRGAAGGRAAVYASWSGEYGFALQRDTGTVVIVDSGQSLKEHDGHEDLVLADPAILFSERVGERPTHFHSGSGRSVVYNDGSGDIVVWNDEGLRTGAANLRVRARVDHGAPIVLRDRIVSGYLRHAEVEVFDSAGNVIQSIPGGSRLHGKARFGRYIAFGLVEGVLLLSQTGETFSSAIIPNPSGTPEGTRVGALATNPSLPFFVGNFGSGLVSVDPSSRTMEVKPLQSKPWRFGIDRSGEYIVVLGEDGVLSVLDRDFTVTASLKLTSPRDPAAAATVATPRLALGSRTAYLLEPGRGEILEICLDEGKVERAFGVPGAAPLWDLALMKTDGVLH